VNVEAVDANGNPGAFASVGIDYSPTAPNPLYSINSNNGNPAAQVGQPVSIQLSDQQTALTDSYSLLSGPSGMTVDPNTGLVSWTPTSSDIGLQTLVFGATNSSGSGTVSVSFYVGPVTTDTNPPNPTYTFTSNGGASYAVAGQPLSIQFTDQNTAQPSVFQLQSGPAGMTIDPNAGLLTWTPTVSDLGWVYPSIAVYNSAGVSYMTVPVQVLFASPVNNVAATGSLATGTISVTWSDPTFAAEPIAGYDVYLSWVDNTGTLQTSGATFVPYGADAVDLTATPGYTTFLVTIVAVDSSGREGAYPASGTSVTLV
jgi:hypothetical protein